MGPRAEIFRFSVFIHSGISNLIRRRCVEFPFYATISFQALDKVLEWWADRCRTKTSYLAFV